MKETKCSYSTMYSPHTGGIAFRAEGTLKAASILPRENACDFVAGVASTLRREGVA
jgi:hypothetical protein